jgi:hypothetical protein
MSSDPIKNGSYEINDIVCILQSCVSSTQYVVFEWNDMEYKILSFDDLKTILKPSYPFEDDEINIREAWVEVDTYTITKEVFDKVSKEFKQ